jgi:hypothetical protein
LAGLFRQFELDRLPGLLLSDRGPIDCISARCNILDLVQAHMRFNLAVSRYPTSYKVARNNAVASRDFMATKMTPIQIAEAQRMASVWVPK